MKKIANLGVYLIPFLNNFIILDFYIYPELYEKTGYGMVYYFLLGSILSFILGFLVSNYSFNPIRFLRKKTVIKFILSIYLVIMIILGLVFSAVALSSIFYINETPSKFITILLVVSLFMLNIKVTTLINTAAILAIVGIPFICYNIISHFYLVELNSFYYIKPNIEFSNVALIFFICLDTFMYSMLITYYKDKSKKKLVSGTIIYFVIEGVEALILVLMLGNSLQGYYGFGYFLYSIEPLSGLIGNFDFVYIFLISLSAIFKLSFSCNIIKLFYFEKSKYVMPFVLSIVGICSFFITKYYYVIDDYIFYMLAIIGVLLFAFLVYLSRVQNEYKRAYSIT